MEDVACKHGMKIESCAENRGDSMRLAYLWVQNYRELFVDEEFRFSNQVIVSKTIKKNKANEVKLNIEIEKNEKYFLYPYEDSSDCIKFGVELNSFDSLYRVNQDDIHLEIKAIQEKEKSKNSIEIFKLSEIYDEHRGCVYDIIQKMNEYSEENLIR